MSNKILFSMLALILIFATDKSRLVGSQYISGEDPESTEGLKRDPNTNPNNWPFGDQPGQITLPSKFNVINRNQMPPPLNQKPLPNPPEPSAELAKPVFPNDPSGDDLKFDHMKLENRTKTLKPTDTLVEIDYNPFERIVPPLLFNPLNKTGLEGPFFLEINGSDTANLYFKPTQSQVVSLNLTGPFFYKRPIINKVNFWLFKFKPAPGEEETWPFNEDTITKFFRPVNTPGMPGFFNWRSGIVGQEKPPADIPQLFYDPEPVEMEGPFYFKSTTETTAEINNNRTSMTMLFNPNSTTDLVGPFYYKKSWKPKLAMKAWPLFFKNPLPPLPENGTWPEFILWREDIDFPFKNPFPTTAFNDPKASDLSAAQRLGITFVKPNASVNSLGPFYVQPEKNLIELPEAWPLIYRPLSLKSDFIGPFYVLLPSGTVPEVPADKPQIPFMNIIDAVIKDVFYANLEEQFRDTKTRRQQVEVMMNPMKR
jgi:hypothetical protein